MRRRAERVFTPSPPRLDGSLPHQRSLREGIERRFEAAEQAVAVHPSVGAAGVPVATRFAGRAFVVPRDRVAHSPLLYVDADVSVSHPNHRLGFDEPVDVSPPTGASLTFGRRYGARFIFHLGEASGGTLTLFQMGGHVSL